MIRNVNLERRMIRNLHFQRSMITTKRLMMLMLRMVTPYVIVTAFAASTADAMRVPSKIDETAEAVSTTGIAVVALGPAAEMWKESE